MPDDEYLRGVAAARANMEALAAAGAAESAAGAAGAAGTSLASFMGGKARGPRLGTVGSGPTEAEAAATAAVEAEMAEIRRRFAKTGASETGASETDARGTGASLASVMQRSVGGNDLRERVRQRFGGVPETAGETHSAEAGSSAKRVSDDTPEPRSTDRNGSAVSAAPSEHEASRKYTQSLASFLGSKVSGPVLNKQRNVEHENETRFESETRFTSEPLHARLARENTATAVKLPGMASSGKVTDRWLKRDETLQEVERVSDSPAVSEMKAVLGAPEAKWGAVDPVSAVKRGEPEAKRAAAASAEPVSVKRVTPVPSPPPQTKPSTAATWGDIKSHNDFSPPTDSFDDDFTGSVGGQSHAENVGYTVPALPGSLATPFHGSGTLPDSQKVATVVPKAPSGVPKPAPTFPPANSGLKKASYISPSPSPPASLRSRVTPPASKLDLPPMELTTLDYFCIEPEPATLLTGSPISTETFFITPAGIQDFEYDHLLFSDEIVSVVHHFSGTPGHSNGAASSGAETAVLFAWIGKDSPYRHLPTRDSPLKYLNLLAQRFKTQLVIKTQQGSEPADLARMLGYQLTVCNGSRADFNPLDHKLFTVVSDEDVIFVHEADTNVKNLCSGYCAVISFQEDVFVWKGTGSSEAEYDAAKEFADDLKVHRDVIVLDEGNEPSFFWRALSGDKEEYANAYYWRFKPKFVKNLRTGIFLIDKQESPQVSRVFDKVLAKPVKSGSVYLIDCSLEQYVIVPKGDSRASVEESIKLALQVGRYLSEKWEARKLPYSPPLHILTLPSYIPRDLRFICKGVSLENLASTPPRRMNIQSMNEIKDIIGL